MTSKIYQISDLHSLSNSVIEAYLKDFLCDDSVDSYSDSILVRPDFQPDSFTVLERLSNPGFLSSSERDGYQFLRSQVVTQIQMLQSEGLVISTQIDAVIGSIVGQLTKLFEYSVNDSPIAAQVSNQEFPDVLRRVIAYCLFGNPNYELHTHKTFNELGARIIPVLLKRHLLESNDLKELLLYSIASGLIGLDLKGASTAASSLTNIGIPLGPIRNSDIVSLADFIYVELEKVISKGLVIDYWDVFINEILGHDAFKLVWFSDDFIETMFDLLLVLKLLDENPGLTISFIPKNGQYGNDASYADVIHMLRFPILTPLSSYLACGRFRIISKGPRMGAINLRKLSKEVTDEIKDSNTVYVKGCRGHEMLQGGINTVTYTSFVVTREFTETETGLDARDSPLVFFRSKPGEYAYWGFKGREIRGKTFSDGRQIRICYSTLEEHERQKNTNDPNILLCDLNSLIVLHNTLPRDYGCPYDNDVALIVDRLCEVTKAQYSAMAETYGNTRHHWPSGKDAALMDELLQMARERAQQGKLGDAQGKIWVLDVGTAHGRDLRYLMQFDDVKAIGVDNAYAFILILEELATRGEIPKDSYYEMDMRNLDVFDDATFDVVRHNASLLHLPVLPNGIGADEAIAESFRVLKPLGLLYVLVRAGDGLKCVDTGEGLGERVYQHYSQQSLTDLLERNGFRVLETRVQYSQRPTGLVKWILVFAEKLDCNVDSCAS